MKTRIKTCPRAIPVALLFAFIATAPALLAQFTLGGMGSAMGMAGGLQNMGMSGMGSAMNSAQGIAGMGGMGGQMGGMGGQMGGQMGGIQRRSMRVGFTPRTGMSTTSPAGRQSMQVRRAPTMGELRRALRLR
jgi:hypothetical protein